MISSTVRGPQFRAIDNRSTVILRSRSSGGTHASRGGVSPMISSASIFRTLIARTLNPHPSPDSGLRIESGCSAGTTCARPKHVFTRYTLGISSSGKERSDGCGRTPPFLAGIFGSWPGTTDAINHSTISFHDTIGVYSGLPSTKGDIDTTMYRGTICSTQAQILL